MSLKRVTDTCEYLMAKGVNIPLPHTLFIGPEVDPERISGDRVTLYPGTRITGKNTLIMPGTILGQEAPVILDNCYVGPETHLKGGFFQDAVFVGKNSLGSGAHVRGGTILEEEANAANTVGLKQTILFPFVTLGSLINFCDCLMAGGTSRKNHSEVGSSYIHFNYTPNQDKATPSMIGNVHQGVMLDKPPIFLGGQGGLVGPRTLAFGTVTAAGTICRRDELRPDRLILGGGMKSATLPNAGKIYRDVKGIFEKNRSYISSLCALLAWYEQVRPLFATDVLSRVLLDGMQATLKKCIVERIHRLDGFCTGLEISLEYLLQGSDGKKTPLVNDHETLMTKWPEIRQCMEKKAMIDPLPDAPGSFLKAIKQGIAIYGSEYVRVIQSLEPEIRLIGTTWLEKIEKNIATTI